MKYNELTRRYFERPGSVGVLTDPKSFRGAAGTPSQGTWVQFDVKVEAPPHARTIRDVRFLAFGCPHVIAASAWIAELAVGRHAEPLLPEDVQSLRERFQAPIEKLGRLLVVEDAWIAAMRAAERGTAH